MTDQKQMNTVDSMLPIPQLFAFGLQHVLAMYAGAASAVYAEYAIQWLQEHK